MAKWLGSLEKKLEQYSLEGHANYRVYISAEPAATRDSHIIPQGILESAIKITNEPPTGMFANLHKALSLFNQVSGICVLAEFTFMQYINLSYRIGCYIEVRESSHNCGVLVLYILYVNISPVIWYKKKLDICVTSYAFVTIH